VLDRNTDGPKPELVRALGASYHTDDLGTVSDAVQPGILIEATGASSVITTALTATKPYGVTVLTGVTSPGRRVPLDVGAANREIVLENDAIVGSVNANLSHYRAAAEVLERADAGWLRALVTRRVPLERALEAFEDTRDDVKVVLEISS
jgi:threonine dehydrogenase-like Zn-dependent dehydrogenase